MLTLPIKKQWFDLILSGEKTEEYRDIKPYYTHRFQKVVAPYYLDPDDFWNRQWEEDCRVQWYEDEPFQICFRNGYSSDSPSLVATVWLIIGKGKPEWGAEPNKEYYVLKIQSIDKVVMPVGC